MRHFKEEINKIKIVEVYNIQKPKFQCLYNQIFLRFNWHYIENVNNACHKTTAADVSLNSD